MLLGAASLIGPFARVQRALSKVRWLRQFAGSSPQAITVLLQARRNPYAVQRLSYGDHPFLCRGADLDAVEEVLVDEEYAFLASYLASVSQPVVIDVGAHIGTFAAWVLSKNSSAKLTSVEADPQTYELVKANAGEAGVSRWRVLHRAAVATDHERVRFSIDGPSMSHKVSPFGSVDVESISLRGLIAEATDGDAMVDVLKVDIEGAEEAFLCGDPQLLQGVAHLVVELHPASCDAERVRRTVEDNFDRVDMIGGRRSRKPLLFGYRLVGQ